MGSDVSLSKAVRANLLSLQNTASMMDKTQNRLATGNKVNSALDNPSSFFTASALNSRAADMGNLLDAMASGVKVIEAANNGLTAITKNVESMQSTLRQARQDKSFNAVSVDVTADTVLNIKGGQLAVDDLGVKLTNKSEGTAATVTSSGYTGASPANVNEGRGARALLTVDASTAGDVITIDGKSITLAAGSNAADITAKLGADATKYTIDDGDGTNGAAVGQILIEANDPTAAAPKVLFVSGNTAATKGTTTFNHANVTNAGMTIGGQTVAAGANFDEFVANLKAKETAGGFTVSADAATKQITVTSATYGATAPAITAGMSANTGAVSALAASSTYNVTLATATSINVAGVPVTLDGAGQATSMEFTLAPATTGSFEIGGAAVNIANTDNDAQIQTKINTALGTLTGQNGGFTASVTGGVVTITAGTNGAPGSAGTTAPTLTDPFMTGITITPATYSPGVDAETFGSIQTKINNALTAASSNFQVSLASPTAGVSVMTITAVTPGVPAGGGSAPTVTGAGTANLTSTNGIAASAAVTTGYDQTLGSATGAHVETVAAATDDIKVTYNGQTADIKIGASASAGVTPTASELSQWRAATLESVNAQLAAKGMNGVEAKFDDTGNLQIAAKNPEKGTLAISGTNSNAIFGGNNVSLGEDPVSAQQGLKPVDKFVDLINTKYAGKLRATNDGGKLRIENLSTQELKVEVDKDGAGDFASNTVKGNSVRENLSKQFNDLRDQLDRLSDDASFNGINLLRGDKLKITFNESGSSSIDIQAKDAEGNTRSISSNTLGIDFIDPENLDTDEAIDAFLGKLSSALTQLRSQASSFGSNLSSVENRQNFTKNMINTLETGAANLTLADTNEEAANLLALQTRQQLSSSALSMASQQDQAVLQLLR